MSKQLHVVRVDEVEPQPWRNGGGVTRELLAWPLGSGADWQLRVSVAEIERDGPFSPFPGVQRCFAVLEGAGVVLSFPESAHRLVPASPPLAFDGGLAPGCRLVGGPTRDLNLMARTASGRPRMSPVGEPPEADPGRPARWRGLYTAQALQVAVGGGEPVLLPPHSLAWCEEALPWNVPPATPATRAWWLELERP